MKEIIRKFCSKEDWKEGKCGCEKELSISMPSPSVGVVCHKQIELY